MIIRVYWNSLRRRLVKHLLGTHLIVEKRDTPSGLEWQLIDVKRRIPYGWVHVQKMNNRDFKLIPSPACELKNPNRNQNVQHGCSE